MGRVNNASLGIPSHAQYTLDIGILPISTVNLFLIVEATFRSTQS